MLQHREQEEPLATAREYHSQPSEQQTETSTNSAPKRKGLRALYDEYVTNNPVYWKESQRPDISTLNPKMRARALANREKREAAARPAWRNLLDALLYLIFLGSILAGISYFLIYSSSTRIPLASLCISPLIGLMGTAAALTRNIILEREKRTWDALLLSHLTPSQILLGKLLPWLKQVAWVALSTMVFVLPGLWQGSVPWLALVIAIPLVFTAPLPGGLYGLRVGLHAESMAKGMGQINKQVVVPVLANLLAAAAGVVGLLALRRLEYNPLPSGLALLLIVPWLMAIVNVVWTRSLWRGLLRNFHKAPTDFLG